MCVRVYALCVCVFVVVAALKSNKICKWLCILCVCLHDHDHEHEQVNRMFVQDSQRHTKNCIVWQRQGTQLLVLVGALKNLQNKSIFLLLNSYSQ